MELTKYAHACVSIDDRAGHLLIDPGTLTPNAPDLVSSSSAVFITHEHPDHFDEELLAAALDSRPELQVFGPASVVGRWEGRGGQVQAVAAGDRFTVEGFDVEVVGGIHAQVHRDIPQVANVGFLINERVYHPGDAYFVPDARVTTLLLPTSGPWTKLGDAADFVRALSPEQVVQIHESMLSEYGQQFYARLLGPDALTGVPVTIVPAGDRIEV